MSGTVVGDVISVETGEWRFEGSARMAHLWKRWETRQSRGTFTAILSTPVGTKVLIIRPTCWFATSKPIATVLRDRLVSYSSPRHNVQNIWSSFDLVSSGFFKRYNTKQETPMKILVQNVRWSRKPAA